MMDRQELIRKVAAVATLHGEFMLRSGTVSNVYFDKYRFEGNPELLRELTLAMVELVPTGVDALAGLEMGGIPIATLLSQHTGLPTVFVRKEAKTYGTCNLAEGGDLHGKRLLIVEDVVTSGGQILLSTAELRQRGAVIEDVVCVIDREAGGSDKLLQEGLRLHALLTKTELDAAS
jgi:orotate phosphoribosyltransferase